MATVIPENVINKIISVVPPHNNNNNNDVDVKLWPGNRMGEFTVAEAYRRMAGFHTHQDVQLWNQIWRMEAP
jgi:hypothetical protein